MKVELRLFAIIILFGVFSINLKAQESKTESVDNNSNNSKSADSTLVASNKAIGVNLFLGQGYYFGSISDYFTNPFFIGLNIDIYKGNFVIQIDDYFGFGKTKQALTFSDQSQWEESKDAFNIKLGSNLGYSLINTKLIKFVPLVGIGLNRLSSKLFMASEFSKHEPVLAYYKLGFFIDLKSSGLFNRYPEMNNKRKNAYNFRLSFGIDAPLGSPKYSEYYKGSTIYFTIGFGGLSRKYEQIFNN